MHSRFLLPFAIFLFVCGLCVAGDQTPSGSTKQGSDTGTDATAADQKASRWPRVRFGGVMVSAGYSHYSGYPGWYGPYGPYGYGRYGFAYAYPWYAWDPFFAYPWVHPGFFNGFGYAPGFGEVKLQAADKTALVYIDGALAGSAGKLRNMWLEPGKYSVEVRQGDRAFAQKVYVLSGKTLSLDTRDMRASAEGRP
jgi:hypothetical protein